MTTTTPLQIALEQDDPRFAALNRLEASRIRLQAALIPKRRSGAASGGMPSEQSEWRTTARNAWSFVRSRNFAGLFQTVSDFAGRWWNDQPWQPTASLLSQTVDAEISPWIRKNPVSAMALGVGAGAAIAWIRPWRWGALHGQARSLQRSASFWMLRELTSPAMQMLYATSIAAWLGQRNVKSSPAPDTQAAPAAHTAPGAS